MCVCSPLNEKKKGPHMLKIPWTLFLLVFGCRDFKGRFFSKQFKTEGKHLNLEIQYWKTSPGTVMAWVCFNVLYHRMRFISTRNNHSFTVGSSKRVWVEAMVWPRCTRGKSDPWWIWNLTGHIQETFARQVRRSIHLRKDSSSIAIVKVFSLWASLLTKVNLK